MQGAKGGFDYGQDIVDDGGSRFDFRRGMVRENREYSVSNDSWKTVRY